MMYGYNPTCSYNCIPPPPPPDLPATAISMHFGCIRLNLSVGELSVLDSLRQPQFLIRLLPHHVDQ